MCVQYVNGGPGVFTSGLVWLFAAIILQFFDFQSSIIVFFIGGMMIHPLSVFVGGKIRTQPAIPDKALLRLALFTLPLLFGGLFLAYIMSTHNQALFYPIMAMAIGIRYLLFKLIYGLNAFILLGLLLTITGIVTYFISVNLAVVPLIVGVIEILIGIWLTRHRNTVG